jgi:two-component system cell cycle sensor histidine kinase/response regulator CckA
VRSWSVPPRTHADRWSRIMPSLALWGLGLVVGATVGALGVAGSHARRRREQSRALADADHQRLEQELVEREQLLEQMGDVAGVGGWERDLSSGRSRWTPQIARIHGLPPDTVPSAARVLDLYLPESRQRAEAAIAAAATDGTPYELELEFIAPDGSHRWVRTMGRPIVDDGVVTRVRGAVWDITAAKEAEHVSKERLALQATLSQLAMSSPGVIYSFRLDPDGRMSFPFASHKLTELFGVTADALAHDAAAAIARVHPDDLARMRGSVARSAETMTIWSHEFRVRHPSRGVIWVEGRSAPSRQDDGSVLWHGFMLDVTDRKLLEEQFRQSQKMEAIGQLAGGVAHDFNNLLTIILGNATLIAEHGGPMVATDQAREIARAADRAASLTRQLLLFSRREVMRPLNVAINDVIANMTRLLQRILGEDIELLASFEPTVPVVRADPGMLEQVLLNLAVNSRDAMPAGGELAIATSLTAHDDTDPGDVPAPDSGMWVCLTVRDTGVGMTPDVQAHMFEPFYTTKDAGKGTGLGLATVYGIVQQHGGWIRVTSTPGAGTTFRIMLPASSGSADEAGAAPAREPVTTDGATVLVVEDEPAVRMLTASVLEQAGYRVITAGSGRLALDVWRAKREAIAAVVTDIIMPDGMTGTDLARAIFADVPDLPVVFVSGYSSEATSAGISLQDGVNFLQKPFQLDDLSRVVRQAIVRRGNATLRGPA